MADGTRPVSGKVFYEKTASNDKGLNSYHNVMQAGLVRPSGPFQDFCASKTKSSHKRKKAS